MFRIFLSKNIRSISIIGILITVWLLLFIFKGDDTEIYLKNPTEGQIYIFENDNIYAPMRLDSVGETHLFMRNYLFMFTDVVPIKKQILEEEFDLNFYAIYEKEEILRLYNEGNLVRIYK